MSQFWLESNCGWQTLYKPNKLASSQAPSYASSKLRPTDLPTGVKCRATSVAKKIWRKGVLNWIWVIMIGYRQVRFPDWHGWVRELDYWLGIASCTWKLHGLGFFLQQILRPVSSHLGKAACPFLTQDPARVILKCKHDKIVNIIEVTISIECVLTTTTYLTMLWVR